MSPRYIRPPLFNFFPFEKFQASPPLGIAKLCKHTATPTPKMKLFKRDDDTSTNKSFVYQQVSPLYTI